MAEEEFSTSPGVSVETESLRDFLSQFPETQGATSEYDQRVDLWTNTSKNLVHEVENGNLTWDQYHETIGKLIASKEWLADHDLLTGLANRRAFEELLKNKADESTLYHFPITLAAIDIDNFKDVNDELGHVTGNKLLIEIGKVLRENMGPGDIVARVGGDELAIVFSHAEAEEADIRILQLKAKLQEIIDSNEKFKNLPRRLGVSFGRARWNGEEDLDALEKRADSDMYKNKNNQKNG